MERDCRVGFAAAVLRRLYRFKSLDLIPIFRSVARNPRIVFQFLFSLLVAISRRKQQRDVVL